LNFRRGCWLQNEHFSSHLYLYIGGMNHMDSWKKKFPSRKIPHCIYPILFSVQCWSVEHKYFLRRRFQWTFYKPTSTFPQSRVDSLKAGEWGGSCIYTDFYNISEQCVSFLDFESVFFLARKTHERKNSEKFHFYIGRGRWSNNEFSKKWKFHDAHDTFEAH
jgi:hypothetical protein